MEIAREEAREIYLNNILGNAAGLTVTDGLNNDEIEARLPAILAGCAEEAVRDPALRIYKSAQRARERLHFLPNLHPENSPPGDS